MLEELRGKCLASDAFVWLHLLATLYADEVVENQQYDRLAAAFVRRGRRFLAAGVDLVHVFDGKPVPAKAETAQGRRERRAKALAEAQGFEPGTDGHHKALAAAVSITPGMVAAVLTALRTDGQRYMVAPYEADSQLRLLDQLGIVDYVLSVDSDMIVLGVRRALLKFKHNTGAAVLFEQEAIFSQEEEREDGSLLAACQRAGPPALRLFSIVAGCDYFKLPNVGPGKAAAIVCSLVGADTLTPAAVLSAALDQATDGRKREQHYTDRFHGADHAFTHAIVYDPRDRSERTLSGQDIPPGAAAFVGDLCTDRTQATDSALGFVPAEFVIGMAVFVCSGKTPPSQCIHGTVVDSTPRGVRLRLINGMDERRMREARTLRLVLPAVVSACRNFGGIGATLTFEHCPGAILPSDENEWTIDNLNAFLRTRKLPMNAGPKAHKVAQVKELMLLESQQIARGDKIRLHDESGASMFEIMAAELVDSSTVVFRSDDPFRPPAEDAPDWIRGQPCNLMHRMPTMHKAVVYNYARRVGRVPDWTKAVDAELNKMMISAKRRIMNVSTFSNFRHRVHEELDREPIPPEEQGDSDDDGTTVDTMPRRSIWQVACEIQRSTNLGSFEPVVVLLVEEGGTIEATPRQFDNDIGGGYTEGEFSQSVVLEVLKAYCPCSSGCMCGHIAALLTGLELGTNAFKHFAAGRSVKDLKKSSCTAVLCRWIVRSKSGAVADVTEPAKTLSRTAAT